MGLPQDVMKNEHELEQRGVSPDAKMLGRLLDKFRAANPRIWDELESRPAKNVTEAAINLIGTLWSLENARASGDTDSAKHYLGLAVRDVVLLHFLMDVDGDKLGQRATDTFRTMITKTLNPTLPLSVRPIHYFRMK